MTEDSVRCNGSKRYALQCRRFGSPGPSGEFYCHDHVRQGPCDRCGVALRDHRMIGIDPDYYLCPDGDPHRKDRPPAEAELLRRGEQALAQSRLANAGVTFV